MWVRTSVAYGWAMPCQGVGSCWVRGGQGKRCNTRGGTHRLSRPVLCRCGVATTEHHTHTTHTTHTPHTHHTHTYGRSLAQPSRPHLLTPASPLLPTTPPGGLPGPLPQDAAPGGARLVRGPSGCGGGQARGTPGGARAEGPRGAGDPSCSSGPVTLPTLACLRAVWPPVGAW